MLTHSADLCSLLSDTVPLLQGEEAGSPIDSKPEVFWPWTSVSVCGVWLSQVMHPYCVFVKHNLSFFWLFVSGGNVTFFFFSTSWLPGFYQVLSMETAWIYLHMNGRKNIWSTGLFCSFCVSACWKIVSVEIYIRFSTRCDFKRGTAVADAFRLSFAIVNTCSHLWFFNSVPVWN